MGKSQLTNQLKIAKFLIFRRTLFGFLLLSCASCAHVNNTSYYYEVIGDNIVLSKHKDYTFDDCINAIADDKNVYNLLKIKGGGIHLANMNIYIYGKYPTEFQSDLSEDGISEDRRIKVKNFNIVKICDDSRIYVIRYVD